jgi:2-polyprenyl-3-methyl-5-hydroxy-6-metoxy-1,4-benzoquinol methylase
MVGELEWRTIAAGHRDASLRLLGKTAIDAASEFYASRGMFIESLQGVSRIKNYTSSLHRSSSDSPSGYWCAIGRPSAVSCLVQAFRANDDETVGRLLGYPTCCMAFFKRIWSDASMVDTTWPMALGSVNKSCPSDRLIEIPTISECVMHFRWLGVRAVFHLPCSYDCELSINLARQNLLIAQQSGFYEEANFFAEMIKWPTQWSALHGIAEIRTPIVKVVARTDATAEKYLVKYLGETQSPPTESAQGVVFPFSLPIHPLITGSKSFELGLSNPIAQSPGNAGHEDQPWYTLDNGFRTRYAMSRSHSPILRQVARLVKEFPLADAPATVVDFGCGNGVLLKEIARIDRAFLPIGVELDPAKVQRARLIHSGTNAEFYATDLFACPSLNMPHDVYLAIVMIGRLLEVTSEKSEAMIKYLSRARHVIVYAYEDYRREHGTLSDMAGRLGITLVDNGCETASRAQIDVTRRSHTLSREAIQ